MSNIESVLNEMRVFSPPPNSSNQANVSGMAAYRSLCKAAEQDYPGFWANLARETLHGKNPSPSASMKAMRRFSNGSKTAN